ncbi:MAG: response regulator [Wenzhouxiangellaceae bacterium]
MRLMIVDDSKIIRNRIQRALSDFSLEVVGSANNGLQATNMVLEVKPDIITMDLTMPEMDGIECIEKVLAINPDLLILVVSALADKATAIEAMKKGAHGFLCKPFTEQELTDALGKLIRGAKR